MGESLTVGDGLKEALRVGDGSVVTFGVADGVEAGVTAGVADGVASIFSGTLGITASLAFMVSL